MIKADKLKPFLVYPEVGWNPHTQSLDPNAPSKAEGVVHSGNKVTVNMTAIRSHFTPEHVMIEQGDEVTSGNSICLETTQDATHGFCIGGYNINLSLEPGEFMEFTFTARLSGNVSIILLHRVLLGISP